MSDAKIRAAEEQFQSDPDSAAGRAHVLGKIIGFERSMGEDTSYLERIYDALDGGPTDAERAAKQRRRAYARAKRQEELQPFVDAIHDAYPDVVVGMGWSRKHGRKTTIRLRGVSFSPTYTSSERYGAGDPDDLLPKLPGIVRALRQTHAAYTELNQILASGEVRRQGGYAVLPASPEHKSYDRRFGGIPVALSHDFAVPALAAVKQFIATGEFTGRNAFGN